MKRQIAAWALTGVMAAGHAVDVQLPWHDDGPVTTTTTTTLSELEEAARDEAVIICKTFGQGCENICDPDDGWTAGCD